MNDKPITPDDLSPEERAKFEAYMDEKINLVMTNASNAAIMFRLNNSDDTDVWCALAYMKGSIQTMGQLNDRNAMIPQSMWDAFEQAGANAAKHVYEREQAAASAKKEPN